MKAFCLGAAGKISRESVLDLVEYSDFSEITIGDVNEEAGREVVAWLEAANDGSKEINFKKVNFVTDPEGTVEAMRGSDIVLDGTPISFNDRSTPCIAEAGCNGINLNGCGAEWDSDEAFKAIGKVHVPGMGMTSSAAAEEASQQMQQQQQQQMATITTTAAPPPPATSLSLARTLRSLGLRRTRLPAVAFTEFRRARILKRMSRARQLRLLESLARGLPAGPPGVSRIEQLSVRALALG